ncbi:MAG: hypothetical protein PHE68_01225, partial [Candidatus Peribacteraceae bacterium]|nr:hypothetical protein [Candidatus Peribacteraceae bacterium]
PRPGPCDGWLLTAGKSTLFEVRADVAAKPANESFRLGFDTANLSTMMQAYRYADNVKLSGVKLNGRCSSYVPCQIAVETTDATRWHLGGTATGAKLTIAQKALASTDTAVSNQRNVNFLRFETRAQNADALFTKAVFIAQTGSPANASNYALWVDTNGDRAVDTILQSGVASQSGQIYFTNITNGGYVIPKDQTVVFEVHGDVASSLTGNELRLGFATGVANYIEAESVSDGSALTGIITNGVGTCPITPGCDITVTTTDSTLWSLRSQGDLYVTRDSQTIGPRQLLAGTNADSVLRLKFHAEYEDIDVTDLQINSSGSAAGSVDSLELWLDGGVQPIAMSGGCGSADVLTVNNGSSTTKTQAFCFGMDSRQLVVSKGSDVKVTVRPRLKSDAQGAWSGEQIAFFVDHTAASNDATGTGSVRARGVASSNNLLANDGDSAADGEVFIGQSSPAATNVRIVGSRNVTVLSKFASITNGGSPTGSMPMGENDIGSFTFGAAANSNSKNGLNQVVLSDIVFMVNATNVRMAPAGFKIYNRSAGPSQSYGCIPYSKEGFAFTEDISGTFLVDCRGVAASGVVHTSIDQGASTTLVLSANVTNANTAASTGGSSILQVSLNDFTDVRKSIFGRMPGQSRIQWRDVDGGGSPTFTWIEYPDTAVNSTLYQG